jgi:BNR/Asp-box repeat protein
MSELLVGTKKGLFVLEGEPGAPFEVATRAFPGDVVEFAVRDPRTGRTFASVTSGFYGPRLFFTDDPAGGEWTQAKGPVFPDDTATSLDRIWLVKPGETDGVLYAGVAPAALFVSSDNGETWELNRALWNVPTRPEWNPGAGGLALHSICPWPGDPAKLAVGISAAGVWLSEDGGDTWRTGYTGLVPLYVPDGERESTHALCVHNMHRSPARPERLFIQFHGSVYRSDDAGETWSDIAAGLPSGFGFPLIVDPADPDSAFVVPLIADADRVTPDGCVRVYETRDAGASWTAHGDGLPQHDAWLTVLRQAFGGSGEGATQRLAFGATSGAVFASPDAGQTWAPAAEHLAPVTSVRFA